MTAIYLTGYCRLVAVNRVLYAGWSFTSAAREVGVSRQYLSRVVWQEVERRHPEVLARWGEGKPPLSWLRKELKDGTAGRRCDGQKLPAYP